jgi:hypothetical protein
MWRALFFALVLAIPSTGVRTAPPALSRAEGPAQSRVEGKAATPPAAETNAPKAPAAPTPPTVETPSIARGAAIVPPAGTIVPPIMRGGRGRGGRPSMEPSANGDFAPIVVRDLHAVVTINGRGSRVVEAIVAFSERSITASDSRNNFTVKSFPYAAVTHVTLSRSRRPRTTGGATLEIPGLPEGNIFGRGPRLWVTVETSEDRLVLRIDPQQMRPLLDVVANRTKVQIERYMEPEP